MQSAHLQKNMAGSSCSQLCRSNRSHKANSQYQQHAGCIYLLCLHLEQGAERRPNTFTWCVQATNDEAYLVDAQDFFMLHYTMESATLTEYIYDWSDYFWAGNTLLVTLQNSDTFHGRMQLLMRQWVCGYNNVRLRFYACVVSATGACSCSSASGPATTMRAPSCAASIVSEHAAAGHPEQHSDTFEGHMQLPMRQWVWATATCAP